MKTRNKLWYSFFISLVMLSCLCAAPAYSQSSANHAIPWDAADGGGGASHSANYVQLASFGQAAATGHAASSSYKNYAGFEVGGDADLPDSVILMIEDSEGKPGAAQIPVEIALENSATPVASLQFRIKYDASIGIHAVDGSAGYTLTSRTQGFAASLKVSENGSDSELLVILFNMNGDPIPAGEGPILQLLFNIDASAAPEDISVLKFTEAVVAASSGTEIPVDSADTAVFRIQQLYDPGDINADGEINVLDVQALLNCITSSGSCERCDLNGDGQYNVLDVQNLINLINNPPVNGAALSGSARPGLQGMSTLIFPDIQLAQGETGTFGVGLTNAVEIAAGQFSFSYDSTSGFDITGVALTDRTQGFYEPVLFHKDASDPANVKILVLYFSLSGATIPPGSGDILTFSYQTTPEAFGYIGLQLTGSILSDPHGDSSPVEHEIGYVTLEEPTFYTILASSAFGGSISPSGEISVREGMDQSFTIIPEPGYLVAEVVVDGAAVGDVTSYTFTDVNAHHTIEAYFAEINSGGTFLRNDWSDAEKSPTNPDDDWMCWAAAAANILDWTGWSMPFFDSAQDIFATFQNYWTNAGGLMEYGWHWWFDGTEPSDWPGWSQLNEGWSATESGGAYWSEYSFFDYFYEDWAAWDMASTQWSSGSHLMATIEDYLYSGYGTSLAIYNGSSGHALSVWGYDYDEYGDYTGLWVTDSDDALSGLKLLSVSYNIDDGLWYLDGENAYNYNGWFIGGVQALDRLAAETPVPEPGTLILIGLGLLNLAVLVRKRMKNTK